MTWKRPTGMSHEQAYGISDVAMGQLAIYNAEVGRGLVHTDAYQAWMAELQQRYDEATKRMERAQQS